MGAYGECHLLQPLGCLGSKGVRAGQAGAVAQQRNELVRLCIRMVIRSCLGELRQQHRGAVARFRGSDCEALILLTPVADPENYGVAELDGERVLKLTEKPADRRSDLALVGVYMFTPAIHDAARAISESPRGELEITDAIQHMLDSGLHVEPHVVRGWWKDTGQLADMLEANRLILDTLQARCDGELEDSHLDGRVVVAAGARLVRSTVRGPAIIGERARLVDAYVGPYTAVGEDCVIESAEVEHSILLAGCEVIRLDGRVESSLLGRNVRISRDARQPRAYRFMLGDTSEVRIP